jgi:heme-degrading monooxygenase HmoA
LIYATLLNTTLARICVQREKLEIVAFKKELESDYAPRAPLIALAEQQLPAARQRPGFQGYYLLTDDENHKVIVISLWETREQMEEVAQGTTEEIHDQGIKATGLISPCLETYEVKLQA